MLCRKKIPRIFLASDFFWIIGDMLPILKIPKKLLLQFFLREIINGLDYCDNVTNLGVIWLDPHNFLL